MYIFLFLFLFFFFRLIFYRIILYFSINPVQYFYSSIIIDSEFLYLIAFHLCVAAFIFNI